VFDLYRIWCSTFIGFSVRPLSDSVFEVEWILHSKIAYTTFKGGNGDHIGSIVYTGKKAAPEYRYKL